MPPTESGEIVTESSEEVTDSGDTEETTESSSEEEGKDRETTTFLKAYFSKLILVEIFSHRLHS